MVRNRKNTILFFFLTDFFLLLSVFFFPHFLNFCSPLFFLFWTFLSLFLFRFRFRLVPSFHCFAYLGSNQTNGLVHHSECDANHWWERFDAIDRMDPNEAARLAPPWRDIRRGEKRRAFYPSFLPSFFLSFFHSFFLSLFLSSIFLCSFLLQYFYALSFFVSSIFKCFFCSLFPLVTYFQYLSRLPYFLLSVLPFYSPFCSSPPLSFPFLFLLILLF